MARIAGAAHDQARRKRRHLAHPTRRTAVYAGARSKLFPHTSSTAIVCTWNAPTLGARALEAPGPRLRTPDILRSSSLAPWDSARGIASAVFPSCLAYTPGKSTACSAACCWQPAQRWPLRQTSEPAACLPFPGSNPSGFRVCPLFRGFQPGVSHLLTPCLRVLQGPKALDSNHALMIETLTKAGEHWHGTRVGSM